MAHLELYKKRDFHKVIREAYRLYDDPTKYKNDVDLSRSHLDRSMEYPEMKFIPGRVSEGLEGSRQALDDRCNAVMQGRRMQSQTKVVGSWVITAPEEIRDNADMVSRFFNTTYAFIKDRYGAENVLDGVIHYDETSPHMTIYVVPACESRKTGKMTVSAASMFTRIDLKGFHNDLEAVMTKELGIPHLVLNGRTKGDYTLEELKERTAREESISIRERNAKKTRERADEALKAANDHAEAVNRDIDAFNEHASGFEAYRARHESEMAAERSRLAQEREEFENEKLVEEARLRAIEATLARCRSLMQAMMDFNVRLSEREEEEAEAHKKEYEEIKKLYISNDFDDSNSKSNSVTPMTRKRLGTDSDLL